LKLRMTTVAGEAHSAAISVTDLVSVEG